MADVLVCHWRASGAGSILIGYLLSGQLSRRVSSQLTGTQHQDQERERETAATAWSMTAVAGEEKPARFPRRLRVVARTVPC